MDKNSKIFVTGHKGLVGSAIVRKLKELGYKSILVKAHKECDLTDMSIVDMVFKFEVPQYVIAAAAKVGGIRANSIYPADFIYQNLSMQTNVIEACRKYKVKKLLFLGSSCIYPKDCPQPIKEEYFLTGKLEPTNESYAIAKIAGIKMCQAYNKQYGTNFICAMPTNLYGPNDNFDSYNSHVLPALIRKFYEAKINNVKEVTLWGDGSPRREFLYVDDLAEACIFLMNNYYSSEIINVGTGLDLTITLLANIIKETIGYKGEIVWDKSKPNGTSRKLDVSKINNLGWTYKTGLKTGIEKTIEYFKNIYRD